MELNIIEDKKNKLVFELVGENHTICNLLREELWNDEDVKVASYNIKHPLISEPRFILETKKDDPRKVIKDALARIKKNNDIFLKKFKSAK